MPCFSRRNVIAYCFLSASDIFCRRRRVNVAERYIRLTHSLFAGQHAAPVPISETVGKKVRYDPPVIFMQRLPGNADCFRCFG